MLFNKKLEAAKKKKNDEFYTRLEDIEEEISAYIKYDPSVFKRKTILLPCDDPERSNFVKYFIEKFDDFNLEKLICTSYAGSACIGNQTKKGKVLILSRKDQIDIKKTDGNVKWHYLSGNGDFRHKEIKQFRNEADIIITNPPFSLFRQFLSWIIESDKKFIIIGNKNCVTYKEVFPLIKNNLMWSGSAKWSGGMWFEAAGEDDVDKVIDGVNLKNVSSVWITNIEHRARYIPIPLVSMEDVSKNKTVKLKNTYKKYDNYRAIEVSFTKFIPKDYDGVMGVPISFLDKYCPTQFEIVGATESEGKGFSNGLWKRSSKITQPLIEGRRIYKRIFIRHKVG